MKLYTKQNCPNCVTIKQYLDNKNVNYALIDISRDEEGRQYLESMGVRSLPQLLIEGQIVPYDFAKIKLLSDSDLGITKKSKKKEEPLDD